ncbi:MAG: delta-60 repeat domain-containing protein, partial [Acidobacteriota bacterium]
MANKLSSLALAAVILLSVTAVTRTNAAPGDLDTTFGIMGQVQDTRMETIHDTLVQPDGKIVVVGSTFHNPTPSTSVIAPAITRYNTDGSLDYGFGNEGWVIIDNVSEYGAFYGLTIQSDGKLIAVGTNRPSALVVRFNSDGTYDTTFSGDGKLAFNFPGANHTGSHVTEVAIIPNSDKILVAGHVEYTYYLNEDCDNAGLARINANGTFDSTFGTLGKRLVDTQESQVSSMAIHPGNKKIALTFTIWTDDF